MRERHTIEIECSDQAVEELVPLLRELGIMGRQGSSRSITIDDWDGKSNFGFDGDGNAKIDSVKVDGKEVDESIKRKADKLLPRPKAMGLIKMGEAQMKWIYTEPPHGFGYVPFDGTAAELLEHVTRLINQNIVDRGATDRNPRVEFTTEAQFKSPGFSEQQVIELLEQGQGVRASIIFDEDTRAGFSYMQARDANQRRVAGNATSLKGYLDRNEIRAQYTMGEALLDEANIRVRNRNDGRIYPATVTNWPGHGLSVQIHSPETETWKDARKVIDQGFVPELRERGWEFPE